MIKLKELLTEVQQPIWDKSTVKDALKQIQIGWGTSLESKSPAIVEFFKNFKITADDVSWMAYEVSVQKSDPGEVARDWMSQNKSTVDGWLGL